MTNEKLKLSNEQFKYLSESEYWTKISHSIYEMESSGKNRMLSVNPDSKSKFSELIHDAIAEFGFDENYELNAVGRLLDDLLVRLDSRFASVSTTPAIG